ncbi:hypothetical protein PZA11_007062 [Diplocarpon coronariae]
MAASAYQSHQLGRNPTEGFKGANDQQTLDPTAWFVFASSMIYRTCNSYPGVPYIKGLPNIFEFKPMIPNSQCSWNSFPCKFGMLSSTSASMFGMRCLHSQACAWQLVCTLWWSQELEVEFCQFLVRLLLCLLTRGIQLLQVGPSL